MAKSTFRPLHDRVVVRRIEAGVSAQAVTQTLAAGMGLSRDWGVVVGDVVPGSAAAAACKKKNLGAGRSVARSCRAVIGHRGSLASVPLSWYIGPSHGY